MNFLIFGGSGFIGGHLADLIKNEVHESCVIYRYDVKTSLNDNVSLLDVRSPIALDIPDLTNSIIYNLAAVHITPAHLDREYFETNILGAENVCNFARRANINTIVFTSSIAPYGPGEELMHEDSLAMPVSPYGISKLSAEYIHKIWQAEDSKNRKLVIVRPGVVFGKSEGGNFSRLYQALKKGFFFYPGRKDTIKASIYVKDVVRILYQASLNEPPGSVTFNLTYYPAPTIAHICETIAEVTGVKKPKISIPGILLNPVAIVAYYLGRAVGKKINGIHPDRVKKVMMSTNVSGEKLSKSEYKLQFNLKEAVADWFSDCDRKGLF